MEVLGLMEVMITWLVGFLTSWVVFDRIERRRALIELRNLNEKMNDNIEKIGKVHNELSTKVFEMNDKVASHDMQLRQRPKKGVI